MTKQEFEALAIRGSAEIGVEMYNSIERFYMSDNNYHEQHGGRNEHKTEFVKRVFGGKVNTPKTIMQKLANEAIKENLYCLQGNDTATKDRLDHMDALIIEHYETMLKYNM